jgi:hypothetical protein
VYKENSHQEVSRPRALSHWLEKELTALLREREYIYVAGASILYTFKGKGS